MLPFMQMRRSCSILWCERKRRGVLLSLSMRRRIKEMTEYIVDKGGK